MIASLVWTALPLKEATLSCNSAYFVNPRRTRKLLPKSTRNGIQVAFFQDNAPNSSVRITACDRTKLSAPIRWIQPS
jgi:hypothetical protein